MATRIDKTSKTKTDQTLRLLSLVLSFLGVLDAIYLLVLKYTQAEAMCVGNHGCITVNNSIYSMLYGIPVSVYGIAAYLAIATILLAYPQVKLARENGALGIFGISLVGVLFSAYLTYLEVYVIHALCPFCVASAIFITLLFILAIIRLVNQSGS